MDAAKAARNLEVIRTLMERTSRYRLLTAWAGLAAGGLALSGALALVFLDAADPTAFGAVWGLVFAGALLSSVVGSAMRGRERGEAVWSRQTRAVLLALIPGLFSAVILTVCFYCWREHLRLPGLWMLCYGQGALATATYAPRPVVFLGVGMLGLGAVTLALSPGWSILMMALAFGLGHVALGVGLLIAERREARIRLHDVA